MNSSLVWKRLARLDDDPTFREIEQVQASFRRKGSKGDFYFLLCDPTDGRYLSTGPASCDTICRDYRIYALYIRHFPFSSSFFISFYLSSSPLERKLNPLEKPPISTSSRVFTNLQLLENVWKNRNGSESRACKLVHVSRCRDFLASNSDYAPMNLDVDCNFTRGLSKLPFTAIHVECMLHTVLTHRVYERPSRCAPL